MTDDIELLKECDAGVKMGITSLVEGDQALTLALGGVTYGISPLEMCGAYSTLANRGVYIEPQLYTKVVDNSGKTLLEKKQIKREVLSEQAAFIVQDMMRDVVRGSNGTATYINIGGNPVAAKTGSTDDYKDRWFCGSSPYYTAAVWYGFDEPKHIYTSGRNPAAVLWNDVMKKAHVGLAVKSFERPTSGIVSASICMCSGMLSTEECENDQRGSQVRSEYFISGTVPSRYCTCHTTVDVCAETGLLPNVGCETVSRVFIQRDEPLPSDSTVQDVKYQVPTETCSLHTELPEVEPDPINPDDPNNPVDKDTTNPDLSSDSNKVDEEEDNPYKTSTSEDNTKPKTGPEGYM